ncbi:hypothetical protein B9Z19DRAFT_1091525, partial [Tuber borchii]
MNSFLFFAALSSGSMFYLSQTCYVRPTRLGRFSLNMGRFFSCRTAVVFSCKSTPVPVRVHMQMLILVFFFTKRSAWGWRKILEGVENTMNKMGGGL